LTKANWAIEVKWTPKELSKHHIWFWLYICELSSAHPKRVKSWTQPIYGVWPTHKKMRLLRGVYSEQAEGLAMTASAYLKGKTTSVANIKIDHLRVIHKQSE